MLDASPATLSKHGTVTVYEDRILVEGFESDGGSCRDVAALAAAWAIGQLQTELVKTLERPGANNICIG